MTDNRLTDFKVILEKAKQWLAQDPDAQTKTLLADFIQRAEQGDDTAKAWLEQQFSARLQFGTAGLRGPLLPGPMGMNRVLVAQTAAGLARYLLSQKDSPSVVIGYDGRKNSDVFARDSAEIMAGAGIKTYFLPRLLPTPVLAYAVRYFDTSAGVMVTASHNPPEDNGYKVYLGDGNLGAQIVSPADKEIAQYIDAVSAEQSIEHLPRSQDYEILDDTVVKQYVEKTASLGNHAGSLKYVYTAMHGVGYETLLAVLDKANLPRPIAVKEQCEPDGRFPTVSFPNPEEKGALDLAIALAQEENAEFILANDPDADRLAVAIADENGQWQTLHGNTIGALLGWYLVDKNQYNQKDNTIACSLVSSPALKAIATRYGLNFEETLTGFKWIGRVPNLVYGYEEALGYLVDPDKIKDKDGISAAVVILDLLLKLKQEGKTLLDYKNDFEKEFGAYASGQVSIRFDDVERIPALMKALRDNPPKQFDTFRVVELIDHQNTDKKSNILVFYLEDDSRIIVRPSGTEPKVKFYIDAKTAQASQAQEKIQLFTQSLQKIISDYQ
ncbi:phospho-sugar mutase [Rappaport israeli]|uniref:phospho-sugar mutase n=1 Tax=Rappaport israeli TaxID=1839807 RepID=UPI000931FD29|nr:phospho-sugar mutase [Rappaport israeli]